MSSQLTQTELLPVKSAAEDNKRSRLVRTSSLERIKQFNTFICSQNYFILPAILASLRTSHTVLQGNFERCIVCAKSIIFDSVCYRFASLCCLQVLNHLLRAYRTSLRPRLEMLAFVLYNGVSNACEELKRRLLIAAVYMTVAAVFTQLLLCVYMLTSVIVPAGLLFLLTCTYLITHINLQCLHYFVQQVDKDRMATSDKVKMPRLSRKDILGKRTISNFNFF